MPEGSVRNGLKGQGSSDEAEMMSYCQDRVLRLNHQSPKLSEIFHVVNSQSTLLIDH